jgi:hypothetical protein
MEVNSAVHPQRAVAIATNKVWAVRAAATAATVALLAISTPLIWAEVSGGLGLVALAAMAAVGTVLLQAIPLGLQRLENRLLRLRKAEAQANPLEQLQNDCLRREERLQSFRRALVTIGGQIESLSQMVAERRLVDPAQVLERQTRALARMAHFYEVNLGRLQEAHAALDAFRHQVKQKMFEWEFAQAGQVVMAALNPSEMNDLVHDLLTDEALRSVQLRFNTVFAELDVEMRSMDSPARTMVDRDHLGRLEALDLPSPKKPWSRA